MADKKKTAAPSPRSPNLTFISQMTLVNADGTSIYKHRISNFAATIYIVGKDAVSLQGNATITMKDGPVKNVPVQVKISGRSLAIFLDKNKVYSHFGASPIYDVVLKVPRPTAPQSDSGRSVSDSATPSKANPSSSSASTSIGSATSSNSTQAATVTNSASTFSSPSPSGTPSSNSTVAAPTPAPSSPTNTTISLAAMSATDLYSWFSGSDENPTLRPTANSDATIEIINETDRKHKLVIQSKDGKQQLAASEDILVGQSEDLTYRPSAPGTLQYMRYYHSPMRGTIEGS